MSFFWERRRGRSLLGLSRYSLLGITIIFSLGFMGIGFAAWNDSLTLNGSLTTGYIKPVFTEATLSCGGGNWGQSQGQGQGADEHISLINILNGGKTLSVTLDDAARNGIYFLTFSIKNEGSLPVELKDFAIDSGDYLKVSMHHEPQKKILGAGEETRGQIKIQVKAQQINEDYNDRFIVELDYGQAGLL